MSPLSLVLERYLNILVPPPARGTNVCATCRRTTEGFERCLQCNRHFQVFGQELADEVVPISLAFKGKQLAHVLWQYKNSGSEAVRRRFTEVLSTNGENTRRMRPELYAVSSDVRSRRVLLVDDTWTSGASLESAAVALKRVGAARVVGLVIGRHLDEPEPAAPAPFDWTACCLCQQV